MVTAALSTLPDSNWLWTHTIWTVISFWLGYESQQHMPMLQNYSVCVSVSLLAEVNMSLHTVDVCYLSFINQSLLARKLSWWFKGSGLVPLCKISLIHPLLSSGEISTRTVLDREQQSSYQLVVVVQDGGSPPRSATGTAFITLLDDNDSDPAFTHSLSGKNLIMQVTTRNQTHRKKIIKILLNLCWRRCLF